MEPRRAGLAASSGSSGFAWQSPALCWAMLGAGGVLEARPRVRVPPVAPGPAAMGATCQFYFQLNCPLDLTLSNPRHVIKLYAVPGSSPIAFPLS